jgi:virginiamycin B lyase
VFARIALAATVMTAAALTLTGLTAAGAEAATPAAASATISEISTPGVESYNMAPGPDGSVWYTATDGAGMSAQVGEVPAGGSPVYFSSKIIQPGQEGEGDLGSITLGSDANLWFTQSAEPSSAGAGVIYRVSSGEGSSGDGPAGTIKHMRAGGILPELGGIISGPGGRLYFTEAAQAPDEFEEVGSLGVHGGVTPGIVIAPGIPGAITVGPGGDLYVAEPGNGTIARLTPQGAVTQVLTGISGLRDLVYADGDLWYTASDAVGRVSVTGGSRLTIPLSVDPGQIVAGPGTSSDLWFTTATPVTGSGGGESGAVGMVTTTGTPAATLLTQGITGLGTFGITATSTQIWFTEGASDRLGVLTP